MINGPAFFLTRALQLAALAKGQCAPNPAVGAIVVNNREVVGEGYHQGLGTPHAEVVAIRNAGLRAKGSVLYVTLEPCCHYGRTPPCTMAIQAAGISQIFYGYADPDCRVNGQGAAMLREAGIACDYMPLPAIDAFYQSYSYWQRTRLPFVTIKLALSVDGKIAGENGIPIKITGQECHEFTQQKRAASDAIFTTINTIINDDPQLNARLSEKILAKPLYILDSQLRLPLTARVFQTALQIYLFHQPNAHISAEKHAFLEERQVICQPISLHENGLNLTEVMQYIGRQGVHDLWVEVGTKCFHRFISQQIAQRIFFYQSSKILGEKAYGGFSEASNVLKETYKLVQVMKLGEDNVLAFDNITKYN